jgi:hypothetical protein
VGSLYIKIIIPTYSRRPPLTEKSACGMMRYRIAHTGHLGRRSDSRAPGTALVTWSPPACVMIGFGIDRQNPKAPDESRDERLVLIDVVELAASLTSQYYCCTGRYCRVESSLQSHTSADELTTRPLAGPHARRGPPAEKKTAVRRKPPSGRPRSSGAWRHKLNLKRSWSAAPSLAGCLGES